MQGQPHTVPAGLSLHSALILLGLAGGFKPVIFETVPAAFSFHLPQCGRALRICHIDPQVAVAEFLLSDVMRVGCPLSPRRE